MRKMPTGNNLCEKGTVHSARKKRWLVIRLYIQALAHGRPAHYWWAAIRLSTGLEAVEWVTFMLLNRYC
jgi:hypothetical protein